MKVLLQILPYLYLLVWYLILGIITYGDHLIMLPLTLLGAFILGMLCIKPVTEKKIRLATKLFSPIVIIFLLASVFGKDFSRTILYVLFVPIFGYIGFTANQKYRTLKIIFVITLAVFFNIYGYNTVHYLLNKEKDLPENLVFPDIAFFDKEGSKIQFKKKFTVLDFWITTCAPCYAKFPDFERAYEKFKGDDIDFYSVNVRLKRETSEDVISISDSLGYSYSTIYAPSTIDVKEKLGVQSYPHLIILQDSTIVYDGLMKTEKLLFGQDFDALIQSLLAQQQ